MSKPCTWPRRCAEPSEAHELCRRHYNKMLRLGRLRAGLLDVAPVRAHIAEQRRRGRGLRTAAALAGVEFKAFARIARGHTTVIRAGTADRIMAVPQPRHTPEGTVRRLRALARVGHRRETIAETAGLALGTVKNILAGGAVSERAAVAIAAAFVALWDKPGDSPHAKALAAHHGYPLPQAWDDIDDAQAVPYVGVPGRKVVDPGEVAWLASWGVPLEDVAQRMGVQVNTVRPHYPRRAA